MAWPVRCRSWTTTDRAYPLTRGARITCALNHGHTRPHTDTEQRWQWRSGGAPRPYVTG